MCEVNPWLWQFGRHISKPSCYHVRLCQFFSIIRIMSVLCHIMSLLYQLFVLHILDYYVRLCQTGIISIMSNYYINYVILVQLYILYQLKHYYVSFFLSYVLCHLCHLTCIIAIMSFCMYYVYYSY